MKTRLLKISVIATLAIILFAGTSWADRGKNRHDGQKQNKHFRSSHQRHDGYHKPSHHCRGWYDHHRRHNKKYYDRHWAAHRAERHAFKHHLKHHRGLHKNRHHNHYRHRVIRKHYHKHKPSHNLFSYKASIFDPGWSITFKTKSRW